MWRRSFLQFADVLEQADDFESALNKLIKKTIKEHKRIIFNGNNYSEEWVKEAEKRGLLNLKTTVDALPHYIEPKNIKLFTKHKIFTESEMYSRYEDPPGKTTARRCISKENDAGYDKRKTLFLR